MGDSGKPGTGKTKKRKARAVAAKPSPAETAVAHPAWVCDDCGNTITAWSALCGKCGAFDAFVWRVPPSVTALPPSERDATPALPPAGADAPADATAG